MPQYLKQYGEQLVRLGYPVVPIAPGGKFPKRKGWQKIRATEELVREWYSNGSANDGVGVIAATCPAIDVDILDPEVACEMADEIDRIFKGQNLLFRTGRAPKFLVPFRSDTPFRKLSSATYTDGTHDHKVEILGDGQQWVAYHTHPDTGKPYGWFDGVSAEGITAVPLAGLPELSGIDARSVIDAFERIAADRVGQGVWRVVGSAGAGEKTGNVQDAGGDPFADQPLGKAQTEVERILSHFPNSDLSYDDWFETLCALHHELGEDGYQIALDWSASSGKHSDEFDKKWNSLGHYSGPKKTLKSLIAKLPRAVQTELTQKPEGGLQFVPVSEFMSREKVEWHIKHVLPKRGLTVLYGAPGSSKSFFALDMVASVARGTEWRGHKVRQSTVAYIAAEGVAGFANRLKAYGVGHGIDMAQVPFYVHGGMFSLKEQHLEACRLINELGNVGVVVIDTLAATTAGGNENTSEDMGLAVDAAQMIIQATGASVILIHHTNKSGEMRGWSGLLGAADNTIRIERKEDVRTAHIEKQKEGKDSGEYGYRLKVVELYEDEDGDMVTSCVVDESQEVAPIRKETRVSKTNAFETNERYAKARRYLQIIEDLTGLGGTNIEEAEVISAIQSDKDENPMGFDDYPKTSNIRRTLEVLGDHKKIYREGRWVRTNITKT